MSEEVARAEVDAFVTRVKNALPPAIGEIWAEPLPPWLPAWRELSIRLAELELIVLPALRLADEWERWAELPMSRWRPGQGRGR